MAVSIQKIVEAVDFVSATPDFGNQAILHIPTGELIYYSEYGNIEEQLPENIDEGSYLELPSKRDLGLGKPLPLSFAYRHLSEEDVEQTCAIYRPRVAHAKFKVLLVDRGLLDEWYAYEEAALTSAVGVLYRAFDRYKGLIALQRTATQRAFIRFIEGITEVTGSSVRSNARRLSDAIELRLGATSCKTETLSAALELESCCLYTMSFVTFSGGSLTSQRRIVPLCQAF
jgi:hypothetical protein